MNMIFKQNIEIRIVFEHRLIEICVVGYMAKDIIYKVHRIVIESNLLSYEKLILQLKDNVYKTLNDWFELLHITV